MGTASQLRKIMEENMRKIVTIGREFGAGGGEIGKRVAKELGIEYYDKDIILKTAVSGKSLSPEQVRIIWRNTPPNRRIRQHPRAGQSPRGRA